MIVRTRFAPSPTGLIHAGGIRTALFAWLLARHNGGQFLLRIEDTDKKREVVEASDYILESLKWLGLEPDEEPVHQSSRLEVYKKYASQLVEQGHAYADPYSEAEVQTFRDQAKNANKAFLYRDHRPAEPPQWDGSQPLRFKIPELKKYVWQDAVRGELSAGEEALDDFVILKSDGFPTYNFAHIVDDYDMKITHVLRGEEFISSTPKFLALYDAFGWQPPVMATMPLVLGIEGGKKLSKRDGSLAVLEYRDKGYLPEAMNNFLASLGWNDGSTQEIFSMEQLVAKFDLAKIQKSPARFDLSRLDWINGHHIRQMPIDDLYQKTIVEPTTSNQQLATNYWPTEAGTFDEIYRKKVLGLVQERLKFFAELPELTDFFFKDLPINPKLISENKQLKKFATAELKSLLETAKTKLATTEFAFKDLSKSLNLLLEETGQKPAVLFSLIRIAITQAPASPGLAETLELLGKERTLERIDQQISALD